MSIDVRTCQPGELAEALTPIWHYFGRGPTEEDAERMGKILPDERAHVAVEDGAVVGGAGAYLFDLTVPGGAHVPTAGVMAVGVKPTHIRRGILTQLMRRQLDDVHERGEPLAALYASEGAIYGRYGYGLASISGDIALPRAHARLNGDGEPAGTARLVSDEEAKEVFPKIYDRACEETVGMLSRSPEWWEIRRFWNPPWAKGQLMCVLVEIDGQPEAYALYRLDVDTEHMVFKTTMQVSEAIGPTPTGMREIWRFLLSVDLVETIKAIWLPPDHPLFLQLAEPRRMRWTAMEGLWLRLVDVGAALSARTYAEEGRLVFEVRDEFCPWNDCVWTLEGGGAAKSDEEPDLRLDAAALASVYLGGFTFADLAWAGRVEELQDGSLARGDAMFRTSRHPWCPEIF